MVRPKKAEGESREKLMQIRLRPAEYVAFKEAAEAAGLDLSGWVRERLRDAVRKERRYIKPSGDRT
ncbi:MAG: hypothetical protein WBC44_09975 [Planctomycetaceae bacterium]